MQATQEKTISHNDRPRTPDVALFADFTHVIPFYLKCRHVGYRTHCAKVADQLEKLMSDVAVVELIRISDLTSLIKHILPHHDVQASRRRRVEMRPAQTPSGRARHTHPRGTGTPRVCPRVTGGSRPRPRIVRRVLLLLLWVL